MNTTPIRRLAQILLVPFVLLAVGCDSGGASLVEVAPEDDASSTFTIFSAPESGKTLPAEGTFKAIGMVDDVGTYSDDVSSPERLADVASVHGFKTLQGTKGMIRIEFYAGIQHTAGDTLRATGGFSIVEGNGTYAGLQGGGQIDVRLTKRATVGALTIALSGVARYAQ